MATKKETGWIKDGGYFYKDEIVEWTEEEMTDIKLIKLLHRLIRHPLGNLDNIYYNKALDDIIKVVEEEYRLRLLNAIAPVENKNYDMISNLVERVVIGVTSKKSFDEQVRGIYNGYKTDNF